MKRIVLAGSLIPFLLMGNQNILSEENSFLDLTVYENNRASISLEKSIVLEVGTQDLILKNIPKTIEKENVIALFKGNPLKLHSQKIISNDSNLEKLLTSHIGKEVTYSQDNVEYSGKLVSVNPTIVRNEELKQVTTVKDNKSIILERSNDTLLRTNISWNVSTDSPSKGILNLKYGMTDMTWNASYAIVLDTYNTMNFQSWINIKNNTGVDFNNANIFIASGDLENKKEKKVFNLFDLKSNQDVLNNETLQINYISNEKVKYKKFGLSTFKQSKGDHGTVALSFEGLISFDNIQEKGLGKRLPSGIINVYEKDDTGKFHLTGTDTIPQTEKFKSVVIKTGKIEGLTGKILMKKYSMSKNHEKGIEEFWFYNKTKGEKEIRFRMVIPKYGNITAKDTCSGECSYSNIQKNIKEYIIHIKEGGEYSFRRTFDIYY